MIIKRVIFDIVLFVSVLIFPWWISIFMLFVGIFIFDRYYEFILFGLIIFSLYSIPTPRIISSPIFFSSIVVFLYILIQHTRSNMILYKK
jgi:hypothetical protein